MATEEPVVPAEPTETVTVAADAPVSEAKPAVPGDEKPKKVKKTSVKRKPRSPSLHPPYFEMIKEAIVTLKERTGSSQYAIAKFIEEKQKNLPANFKKLLSTQLKKFVVAGKLVKVKASYKLPATSAPASTAPAKKKPTAKPKAAVKPKTVKKITPAKKKTVSKLKPAPKEKVAPKPKAAAKPKPAAKPKAAAIKAKPKAKAPTKPSKVARTSTKSTPGKKAPAVPKKATVKSLKPKAGIVKKATAGTKKAKK